MNTWSTVGIGAQLYEDQRDVFQQAECLWSMGVSHRNLRDAPSAIACFIRAADAYRSVGQDTKTEECEEEIGKVRG